MVQCVFNRAQLAGADLRDAKLDGSEFAHAALHGAQMAGASLFAADLRAADLTGARGLRATQLMQARTDESTILPNKRRGPYIRGSGAERPAMD